MQSRRQTTPSGARAVARAFASVGLAALALLLPRSVDAQGWVGRHSSIERIEARLTTSTSSSERRRLAESLGRLGPPEVSAEILARALGTETEPEVRAALLIAATRVAVVDPIGARALESVLLERYGQASPGERAPLARALAALGSPAAIDALVARLGESNDALVEARASSALLDVVARETTGSAAQLDAIAVLARIADPEALSPLLARLGTSAELDAPLARALAAMGPRQARVRRALLARLGGIEDARALTAILEALSLVAPTDGEDLAPLVARTDDADPGVARTALEALALADPAAALARLRASPDVALEVLAVSDAPALVPLARELATGETRDSALDFLARAAGGAGIDALIALDAPPLAIALAARRAGRAMSFPRLAGALAGASFDASLLASPEADVRLEGAMALALSEHVTLDVSALLDREPDERVRVWLLEAVRRHRLSIDARWIVRALSEVAVDSPERSALLLVAPFSPSRGSSPSSGSHAQRALAHAMSAALLDERPEVRAAAAIALADAGSRGSSAAIEALLEDPQASVRIAAAVSLSRLCPERWPFIDARARIDLDPRVRRVLSSLRAPADVDVLLLDTEVHGDASRDRVWLEVQTDDGLFRILPASPTGAFVLVDVPGATAEVSLRLR